MGDTALKETIWKSVTRAIHRHRVPSAHQKLFEDMWDRPVDKVNRGPCPCESHFLVGREKQLKSIISKHVGG